MDLTQRQLRGLSAALLALSFAFAQGESKPNFSGTWKLNAAKSDLGGHDIGSLTLKIRHQDPELLMTHIRDGETLEFKLGTDGKEYSNETPDGTMKTTLHWESGALIGSTDYAGHATFKDKWWITDDGRTMRITRHIKGPEGEQDWSIFFDKEK